MDEPKETGAVPPVSVALVTGGGGGLGEATARQLIDAGYVPVLLGRNEDRLRQAAERLGPPTWIVTADVADRDEFERALNHVDEDAGTLRAVVHAAGVAPSAKLLPPDDALWDEALRTNARGTWVTLTSVLPRLREKGGTIVVVASTASLRAYRYATAYVASKHAVMGIVRSIVEETRNDGLRVCTVCPGFMDTPLTRHAAQVVAARKSIGPQEALEALGRQNKSGRLLAVEDVARVILELIQRPGHHGEVVTLE